MTERAVRARRDAIRAEYLDEETEAAEAEGLENDQAVLSMRVPAALAETLKARAAEEHVPTSALIRRILVRAVRAGTTPVLTVEPCALTQSAPGPATHAQYPYLLPSSVTESPGHR